MRPRTPRTISSRATGHASCRGWRFGWSRQRPNPRASSMINCPRAIGRCTRMAHASGVTRHHATGNNEYGTESWSPARSVSTPTSAVGLRSIVGCESPAAALKGSAVVRDEFCESSDSRPPGQPPDEQSAGFMSGTRHKMKAASGWADFKIAGCFGELVGPRTRNPLRVSNDGFRACRSRTTATLNGKSAVSCCNDRDVSLIVDLGCCRGCCRATNGRLRGQGQSIRRSSRLGSVPFASIQAIAGAETIDGGHGRIDIRTLHARVGPEHEQGNKVLVLTAR